MPFYQRLGDVPRKRQNGQKQQSKGLHHFHPSTAITEAGAGNILPSAMRCSFVAGQPLPSPFHSGGTDIRGEVVLKPATRDRTID
jgi:hypothetical protein